MSPGETALDCYVGIAIVNYYEIERKSNQNISTSIGE